MRFMWLNSLEILIFRNFLSLLLGFFGNFYLEILLVWACILLLLFFVGVVFWCNWFPLI